MLFNINILHFHNHRKQIANLAILLDLFISYIMSLQKSLDLAWNIELGQ